MENKKAISQIKKKLSDLMGSVSALLEEEISEQDRLFVTMISAQLTCAYRNLLTAEYAMFPAKALKPAAKKPKPEKKRFGEFGHVLMTDSEREKLVEIYGKARVEEYTEKIDLYCESRKAHYSSGYATMLNWLKKDNVQPQQGRATDSGIDRQLLEQFMRG